MPIWLIGVGLVGAYLWWTGALGGGATSASTVGWVPMGNPAPLAPEQRDAYAQAFAQKPGTVIRFLIQNKNGTAALAIGTIDDVKIQDNKRLWKVSLISASVVGTIMDPGGVTTLPAPGAVFIIGDQHISA